MYVLNINAKSTKDAVDKMERWGFKQDVDFVLTNAEYDTKQSNPQVPLYTFSC